MADITWTDVTDYTSELSVVDTDAQTMILAYANDLWDPAIFDGESGPKLKLIRVLTAAHFGKLSLVESGTLQGAVIAESAGGLSRQYAMFSPAGTLPLWSKTTHGVLLTTIIRMNPYSRTGILL